MPWKPRTYKPRHTAPRDHKQYEQKRMADPALRESKKIRNSARWQRFRNSFKKRHPLCWLCEQEGRVEPVAQVHHIQSLRKRPDLAYVEYNCVSLCEYHHNKINGAERRGVDTTVLFKDLEYPEREVNI